MCKSVKRIARLCKIFTIDDLQWDLYFNTFKYIK